MEIGFSRGPGKTLIVRLGWNWNIAEGVPLTKELQQKVEASLPPEQVIFDAQELGTWDSSPYGRQQEGWSYHVVRCHPRPRASQHFRKSRKQRKYNSYC
jgi:hypothetical protein